MERLCFRLKWPVDRGGDIRTYLLDSNIYTLESAVGLINHAIRTNSMVVLTADGGEPVEFHPGMIRSGDPKYEGGAATVFYERAARLMGRSLNWDEGEE